MENSILYETLILVLRLTPNSRGKNWIEKQEKEKKKRKEEEVEVEEEEARERAVVVLHEVCLV